MPTQLTLFEDGRVDRAVDDFIATMGELGLTQDQQEEVVLRLIFSQTWQALRGFSKPQRRVFLALLTEAVVRDG